MGASRSVPDMAEFPVEGVAKGRVSTSLAPLASSGFQISEAKAFFTHSSRETMAGLSDKTGGSCASTVVIDFELSQRMVIFGFESGWMTVRHSGCHSRRTTTSAETMRRISSTIVRPRCGLRCHVRNDKTPMAAKETRPIQRVTGVGDR